MINPRFSCFVLRVLLLLCWTKIAQAGGAFTPEQRTLLDHIVNSGVTDFRRSPEHLDSLLNGLNSACAASDYGKDPTFRQVLQRLRDEAAKLKEEVGKVATLVERHGAESDRPAVILLLLSRQQSLGFHLYRWARTVTELTDLANATIHREDALTSKLSTALIQVEEERQETLASAIQGLTGVIGQGAKP